MGRTLEMQLLLQYLMQNGFGDATPSTVFDEQDFGDATPPTVFDAAGIWRCNSSYSIWCSRDLEMQLLLQYLMQQGFGDATPPTVFGAAGIWRHNSSYSI